VKVSNLARIFYSAWNEQTQGWSDYRYRILQLWSVTCCGGPGVILKIEFFTAVKI